MTRIGTSVAGCGISIVAIFIRLQLLIAAQTFRTGADGCEFHCTCVLNTCTDAALCIHITRHTLRSIAKTGRTIFVAGTNPFDRPSACTGAFVGINPVSVVARFADFQNRISAVAGNGAVVIECADVRADTNDRGAAVVAANGVYLQTIGIHRAFVRTGPSHHKALVIATRGVRGFTLIIGIAEVRARAVYLDTLVITAFGMDLLTLVIAAAFGAARTINNGAVSVTASRMLLARSPIRSR